MQCKKTNKKIMTDKNNPAANEERFKEHTKKKCLHRQCNKLEKEASEESGESSEQNLSLETSLEAAISTPVLSELFSTSSLSLHRSLTKKVAPARASSMKKSD